MKKKSVVKRLLKLILCEEKLRVEVTFETFIKVKKNSVFILVLDEEERIEETLARCIM